LDSVGFTNTESIISETNIDLGSSGNKDLNSPKGAAWFASMLITAQKAPLDRLIMYRGDKFMSLLKDDINGQPHYTWNGLGFKSFAVLADEAPMQIDAQGSIFIDDSSSLARDTTNLMIMAAKPLDNKSCYTIISNFNSTYNDFSINYSNLPWVNADSLQITEYKTAVGFRFVENSFVVSRSDSLSLAVSNMAAPSVILIKMSPLITTDVENENTLIKTFELKQNYPNPFNPSTKINYKLSEFGKVTLKVYDILGNEITTLVNKEQKAGNYSIDFNTTKISSGNKVLASGVYLYKLNVSNFSGSYTQTKKMVILK